MKLNIRKSIALLLSTAAIATGSIAATADKAQAYTDAEAQFIVNVTTQLSNAGQSEIVRRLGHDFYLNAAYNGCDRLNEGESLESLLSRIASTNYDPIVRYNTDYALATAVFSGILHLCPQHTDQFNRLVNGTSQPASSQYYAPSGNQTRSCVPTLRPDTNIRSGPSTTSSVIANESTLLNDAIEIHSTEEGRDGYYWSWIGFQGSDGRTAGWVQSDLINRNFCD